MTTAAPPHAATGAPRAGEVGPAYHYPDTVRPDILSMVPPDGRVVGSVGCGTAATEATLVGRGYEVYGTDVSEHAVAVASGRLAGMTLVRPGDPLPFAPESLDGLIFADVLEHIPQAWEVLAEGTRAVRPGGWVVVSVPNMRSWKVLLQFFVRGDWPESPEGIFDRTHLQVMSRRRLERWCRDAGLVPERWLDQYALAGRRQRALRLADAATFRLFHEFCQHRLIVRCRVTRPPR